MNTIEGIAESIVETAGDYRTGDWGGFTTEHVVDWVQQFDNDAHKAILTELDHVLKMTYFSGERVEAFLTGLATNAKLSGDDPEEFWAGAGVLDIQLRGNSQSEMLTRFDPVLQQEVGLGLDDCQGTSGTFVYLDDGVFSGNRVRRDLEKWIAETAPEQARVHIIVNALHSNGHYYANDKLRQASHQAQKQIETTWWRAHPIENQRAKKDESQVLWPAAIPDEEDIQEFVEELKNAGYPPQLRLAGQTPTGNGVFSSEEGRAILETEFLRAGVKIRTDCPHLPDNARPLGFTLLRTLGFGATTVNFRNCPNNCPLAFWAGDPWRPLFPRRTN